MHPAPLTIVAQVQADVLGRSFLLAVLVVAPFGLWRWWKVRAARRQAEAELAASQPAPPPPPVPPLEDVVAALHRLGRELAAGDVARLEVPAEVTVDGNAAPAEVVDVIVADAIRRSGLRVEERHPAAEHTTLVLRRSAADGGRAARG